MTDIQELMDPLGKGIRTEQNRVVPTSDCVLDHEDNYGDVGFSRGYHGREDEKSSRKITILFCYCPVAMGVRIQ